MSQDKPTSTSKIEDLDWIRIRENLSNEFAVETVGDRTIRKIRENPLVPIGCTATVAALIYGVYSFSKGRSRMSQYMMRARVAAQGFTILAIVVGFMFTSQNKK